MKTFKEFYDGISESANYTISQVHISTVKIGDTVEHGGKFMTVGKGDIKTDSFMGTSLFGDSYSLGHKKVKKVTFKTPKPVMKESLNEETDTKAPYRAIFSETGRKVNLTRSAKLFLGSVDSDDNVTIMTPKEFFASKLPYEASEYLEKQLIRALMAKLQFNKQVELNVKLRNVDKADFEKRLSIILDAGAKLTKAGIKV